MATNRNGVGTDSTSTGGGNNPLDDNSGCIGSPSQIAMTGHDFTPEDITALLCGVAPESVVGTGGVSPATATTAVTGAQEAALQHPSQTAAVNFPLPTSRPENTLPSTAAAAAAAAASAVDNACEGSDKTLSRVERKRKLEKQRRSDVNRQFSELQAALRRIESEEPDLVRGLPAYTPSNRVDLIARTVSLLNNLQDSNKRHKTEVTDLQEQLENAKKAGEQTAAKLKETMMAPQSIGNNKVMMMVPMMIGGDNNAGAAVPMMQPWMPPQANAFMAPAVPQVPGTSNTDSNSTSSNVNNNANANRMMAAPWMMQQPSMPWFMTPTPTPTSTNSVVPNGMMGQHMHTGEDPKKSSSSGSEASSGSSVQSGTQSGNLAHCA